jgi:hypothetical protein
VRETPEGEIASIATDNPYGDYLDIIFMDPLPTAPPPGNRPRKDAP